MSSLTRSLLALAVLLVAANAQEDNCSEETFGEVTDYAVTLETISNPVGRITIPDICQSKYGPGFYAVGEDVKACNVDENGEAPDIDQVNPPDLSPVDIECPDAGCPLGVTVDVTEYCSPDDA